MILLITMSATSASTGTSSRATRAILWASWSSRGRLSVLGRTLTVCSIIDGGVLSWAGLILLVPERGDVGEAPAQVQRGGRLGHLLVAGGDGQADLAVLSG